MLSQKIFNLYYLKKKKEVKNKEGNSEQKLNPLSLISPRFTLQDLKYLNPEHTYKSKEYIDKFKQ